jgi:hypothetical protein
MQSDGPLEIIELACRLVLEQPDEIGEVGNLHALTVAAKPRTPDQTSAAAPVGQTATSTPNRELHPRKTPSNTPAALGYVVR